MKGTDLGIGRSSSRKLAGPASLLAGVLAVISVWLPVLSYYAVPQVAVKEPDVSVARSTPSDVALWVPTSQTFLPPVK